MAAIVRRRVAVAISGGVDSSVAAYLLSRQQQHYDIVGLHMKNWEPADEDLEPHQHKGCLEQDSRDAEQVCRSLDIPLYYASFAAEYWTGVFEPFVEGIAEGSTPNPDVRCNTLVKFGAMKDYAKKRLGIDWIATGHYARLWKRSDTTSLPTCVQENLDGETIDWLSSWGSSSSPLLLAGADRTKDQSYFLAQVEGSSFENVLFPLGDLYKKSDTTGMSVRKLAQQAQLPTAQKRESMGICFVGKRDFSEFIHQYLPTPPHPGVFVDVDTGEIVGRHQGSLLYTIGQGAKIAGAIKRWFVVGRSIDDDTTLLVCSGTHHPALYSNTLFLKHIHWIGATVPPPLQSTGRMRAKCRIRHLQPLISCEISGHDQEGWTIRFDKPMRAITTGQLAALYVGDDGLVCLGGGNIWQRGASYHEHGMDLPSDIHPAGHNDTSLQNNEYG